MATADNATYNLDDALREDLEDVIYNISPMDTYFLSNVERMKASATLHQWQIDTLAAASTANAAIEGDDFDPTAVADTTRYKNYTQILRKEVVISGTLEAVDKAGMDTQMAYQIAKKGKELKRDLETILLHTGTGGSGATAGAAASARAMAGVENWIFNTAHIPATGQTTSTTTAPSSGVANNTPVDGSSTALLESDVRTCLATAWTEGGETDVILVGTVLKRTLATFTGLATRFRDVGSKQQAQIIGAVDVYVSDYGNHKIVLSRYVRSTSVLFLDMSLWGVAYLRPFQAMDIAATGDAKKKMVLCEATLVAKNPLGHAKITGVV
jgi:hypothetical protein